MAHSDVRPHPPGDLVVGTYVHAYDPASRASYQHHIPGMRPSQDPSADYAQARSATPIYDALYAEYRRLFRALPGDTTGDEDLGFKGFAALGQTGGSGSTGGSSAHGSQAEHGSLGGHGPLGGGHGSFGTGHGSFTTGHGSFATGHGSLGGGHGSFGTGHDSPAPHVAHGTPGPHAAQAHTPHTPHAHSGHGMSGWHRTQDPGGHPPGADPTGGRPYRGFFPAALPPAPRDGRGRGY
ncbi:hypothetical protein [Streptomyces sp. SAJ15]|uniref:hypothetical protein n=1 Tax=Streptomyces sp. SAJ15 TaxID=2011095 RepID=UPI0011857AFD|nr:hypothetical protein [Streptomyces sp. SAJ15]